MNPRWVSVPPALKVAFRDYQFYPGRVTLEELTHSQLLLSSTYRKSLTSMRPSFRGCPRLVVFVPCWIHRYQIRNPQKRSSKTQADTAPLNLWKTWQVVSVRNHHGKLGNRNCVVAMALNVLQTEKFIVRAPKTKTWITTPLGCSKAHWDTPGCCPLQRTRFLQKGGQTVTFQGQAGRNSTIRP